MGKFRDETHFDIDRVNIFLYHITVLTVLINVVQIEGIIMFQLDYMDHRPLYEQIKEKIKALIISGVLKANDKIPSVRELAQSLTINPNTIQKAYKDLELEGFIYSIRAKGSFVTPLENAVNQRRKDELLQELEKSISELMYMQVSREEVISCIDSIYKKKEADSSD